MIKRKTSNSKILINENCDAEDDTKVVFNKTINIYNKFMPDGELTLQINKDKDWGSNTYKYSIGYEREHSNSGGSFIIKASNPQEAKELLRKLLKEDLNTFYDDMIYTISRL